MTLQMNTRTCYETTVNHYVFYGCTGFGYLKLGRKRTWSDFGIQMRPEPDFGRTCFRITQQYLQWN